MSDAVTAGTFSDFKLVKTRKVAQFVIEFPLERADEALEMLGGLPRPDREVWVAIARLKADPFTATGSSNGRTSDFDSDNAGSTPAPVTTPAPAAEPERRVTLNANRAGMMIKEPLFWQWVSGHGAYHGPAVTDADAANVALLSICKADRKRDLDADLDAAARFDRIRRDYYAWTQEPLSPAA